MSNDQRVSFCPSHQHTIFTYSSHYSFRTRLLRRIGPNSKNRFIRRCAKYIEAVSIEAELREQGKVLDLKPYIHLRRENSAIRLCFELFEMCLGIDLPDYVFEDPIFMTVYFAACDHVAWANVRFLSPSVTDERAGI